MIPLEPNTVLKYPPLVHELHDALRTLRFPGLPEVAGRKELLARLLGTGISQALHLLDALHRALPEPGDVCEFGTAQGATAALLANEIRSTNKCLWLFDTFTGLPPPSPQDQLKDDIFGLGSIERYTGEMRCDPAEVTARLDAIGFPVERRRIRPGLVEQTLTPAEGPGAVCLAYVDFDFYAPIRHALEYLDEHLAPGGRIMVDDYDFFSTGAKTAVDEFVGRRRGRYRLTLAQPYAGHFCLLERERRPWRRWFPVSPENG
jgi:O-methyltransferase